MRPVSLSPKDGTATSRLRWYRVEILAYPFVVIWALSILAKTVTFRFENTVASFHTATRSTTVSSFFRIENSTIAFSRNAPAATKHRYNATNKVGNLFVCGYKTPTRQYATLFPFHEPTLLPENPREREYHSFDVLVADGGDFRPVCKDLFKNKNDFRDFVKTFPGRILVTNPEPYDVWRKLDFTDLKHAFKLGYYDEYQHPNYLHVALLQTVLLQRGPNSWRRIMHHPSKVHNTGERFLIYAASNCVSFRDQAFRRLSEIGVVDQGGRCGGAIEDKSGTNIRFVNQSFGHAGWVDNASLFHRYRFCLVMENTNKWGYLTEKVLNAWEAGCVPIFYGSRSYVEKFFNPKAMVFYDVEDPEPALEQIRYLENNATAYQQVLHQEPILAHGNETIREFFSFVPQLGNAQFIRHVHERMGLPYLVE